MDTIFSFFVYRLILDCILEIVNIICVDSEFFVNFQENVDYFTLVSSDPT